MQKKIIALAVAALASSAAFAQSNVTIYGIADLTFDVVNVSGDDTAAARAAKTGSFTRTSANSSLMGFKGSEALGNGTNAVFQFEGGVGPDTGAAFSFNRDSFAGLEGGFGKLVLGNLTGPTRALGSALDVNAGATGIAANSAILGKLGNRLNGGFVSGNAAAYAGAACVTRSATCTSVFDTRMQNAIAYTTPNLSGFSATLQYVANENKTPDVNTAAGTQQNAKGYDLGGKYANGPIMVALTYAELKAGNATDQKVTDTRLGGSYDFGVATVRAVWDSVKYESNVAGTETKQNVWGLGGTFNASPAAKIIGQYYKANKVKIAGADQADTAADLAAIGVEYSLSKRTMIKAIYSRIDNDNAANYDFGLNATGLSAAGSTVSGFQVGVRHAF